MTPMMTTEEFKTKVHSVNPAFEILSDYHGLRQNVTRRCALCGDTRQVQARMLLDGRRCTVCAARERAKQRTKTHDQFVRELSVVNANVEVLSRYVNNGTKIKCRCKVDGFVWETLPHSLLSGHGCPECGRSKNYLASLHRRTHEEYVAEISTKFPHIDVCSQFHNVSERMTYHCRVCGYEWAAVANTLLNCSTRGCPRCAGIVVQSEDMLVSRLALKQPTVRYLCGFVRMDKPARFSCIVCGYEWESTPHNVLKSKGCPHCASSLGEQVVENYLKQRGIDYKTQYRFEGCKSQRPLPFDFYLPNLNIAIEYDGEQHFMPVRFHGRNADSAYQDWQALQERDNIKNDYCTQHGIYLIRIPYTDFDKITDILDKHIP